MIDRGDIRQVIDRCSNILPPPGAGYGRLDTRPTAWLQNSKKRAERSERLMYEQSHRDYLRSGYLHHRLPVAAVNHYRDNAITWKSKAQNRRTGYERGNYRHADASVSVMLLRSIKYTKEWVDAKAENDVAQMTRCWSSCCTSAVTSAA